MTLQRLHSISSLPSIDHSESATPLKSLPHDPEPRENPPRRSLFAPWKWSKRTWIWLVSLSPGWYFLSSGPVMAITGRLVYYTGWESIGWMVVLFYAPLYLILPADFVRGYLHWWLAWVDPHL